MSDSAVPFGSLIISIAYAHRCHHTVGVSLTWLLCGRRQMSDATSTHTMRGMTKLSLCSVRASYKAPTTTAATVGASVGARVYAAPPAVGGGARCGVTAHMAVTANACTIADAAVPSTVLRVPKIRVEPQRPPATDATASPRPIAISPRPVNAGCAVVDPESHSGAEHAISKYLHRTFTFENGSGREHHNKISDFVRPINH
jgi:hypothetical protein